MRSSPAPTISSLLHSCPGLATYWRVYKCCVTYLLTYYSTYSSSSSSCGTSPNKIVEPHYRVRYKLLKSWQNLVKNLAKILPRKNLGKILAGILPRSCQDKFLPRILPRSWREFEPSILGNLIVVQLLFLAI